MFIKPIPKFFVLLLLLFPFVLQAKDPQIALLSQKPLGEIHFPELSLKTLPNGMKIYFLEDHELPTFRLFAYIRGGSIYDPPEKVGLAALMATVLRTGGTKQRSIQDLDRFLEDRGASLETGMGNEYGSAQLKCLSADLSQMLPLFFEVLSSPRFSQDQIDLARLRFLEGLQRQNDNPEKIAFREFPKLFYGKDSPWARTPDKKSLDHIGRKDLFDYHQRFYHPDRIVLAVAGDFKSDELISLIEKTTQGWSHSTVPLPTLEPVKKEWEGGIHVIDKKGGQSTVLAGHFGEKRFNPDKFAIILMNYLLGGDIFSSSLGEQVRSSRGLAYSVFSHFGLETDYGLFFEMAQTQTLKTAQVVRVMQDVTRQFRLGKGLNEASLKFAKEAILTQMINDWEPRFNFVKERARLSLYGYPENYLEIFRKSLDAVTLPQVRLAAKKYLFPDQQKVLVVGDLEAMKAQLESLGKIQVIPLSVY